MHMVAQMFSSKQTKLHNRTLRVLPHSHSSMHRKHDSLLTCFPVRVTTYPCICCCYRNRQAHTDVMHCGALPNRSAATRYDFEDTPRQFPHIYVNSQQTNQCTRSMLRDKLLRLHTYCFHAKFANTRKLVAHCFVHARYRHPVVDPAGSLTPRLLRRPAERHDEFGRRGTWP